MGDWFCYGLLLIFAGYSIYKIIIIQSEISNKKKQGLRITWTNGYVADSREKGDGTLEHMWLRSGYIWHEKWKRWVPDITRSLNEDYWEKRGYRWSENRRRWYKPPNA
jgi:hypothetical protein